MRIYQFKDALHFSDSGGVELKVATVGGATSGRGSKSPRPLLRFAKAEKARLRQRRVATLLPRDCVC